MTSLRKGSSLIDLQYAHSCDSITAEGFEVNVKDGKAVIRATLRPSGGHQRDDEQNLHSQALQIISINETQIVKNLQAFHSAHMHEYSSWKLELISIGKILGFEVGPEVIPPSTLHLKVQKLQFS